MKENTKLFKKCFEDVFDRHMTEVCIALPDNDEDWGDMEMVFDHHPVFSGHQIASFVELYRIGGMTVIRDMLPTAEKAKGIEDKMRELDHEKRKLMLELKCLKKGGRAWGSI
ncbi:MAG: hypothetical protein ACI4W2_04755 [Eubacterium sp.]